ncbi:Metallo-hydrolase/oxidoreductase [Dichomitus squalens LYAD-421 SS1]|uniref:Metallo-hydrolase/oxidoreductase n=1 Tax=Dichomitus squalens (strain LYAD-421) TaxID=732165 RepID=UPI0004415689|nr:Metallo-hydrolase/oxidoreductase [Dichomitus squalens LYAD-421 SS1]EJF65154.1 Metallo-hydrolase/oxidoreductase [Dichomitus squalens LYAD-421 SS1]
MSDVPKLRITLLGAGQEVGRSCCVIQYRGRTIVCDAGVHPAYSGIASLPFIDDLDWSTVDVLLITHFHLDHAAALTYIMEKTNFRDGKGKVYMTHPTKALHKFMMQDFVRMSTSSADTLFTPLEMSMSLASIIPVSAHQVITPCPGVTFTPYHAGHVLGACMFLIDIAGLKILYTGDYSREEDRHLVKAEIPPIHPDVLIVESTYGVQSHEPRDDKEARFTNLVHSIIRRGGHVLLPTFALGRAQELLLILDEYWAKHPDLHNVPIYYASSLARKCMAVYQTYIHTMNSNVRTRFAKRDNPFVFKHITNVPGTRGWERKIAEGPPCVVLASPGFMNSGPSRELLELWASDSKNGCIVTGYSVEGTMARDILNEPSEIVGMKGNTIQRKLSVDYISFSAHVDYSQNSEFMELVKPQHIVLVHGEATGMGRLKAAMQDRYKSRDEEIKIHTPRNLETLELTFRSERVAKAIGTLAAHPPQPNDVISGLLVSKDYSYTLLDPRDLRDFAGLTTCVVTQRQKVALGVGWDLVRWHLEGMFGQIEEGLDKDGIQTMRVMGAVDVKLSGEQELTLEWDSSASNDMIADATLALISGIDKSPASVKLTTHAHSHSHPPEHRHPHADITDESAPVTRIQRLCWFLEAHFGDVELHMPEEDDAEQSEDAPEPSLLVTLDEADAVINLLSMTVTSSSEALRRRVEAVLDMAVSTVSSLSEAFTAGVPLQVEEAAQGESGGKDKSGSSSGLPAIPEDREENPEKDVSMEDAEKPEVNGADTEVPQADGEDGAAGDGDDGDDGDDGEDEEEEDDAILQVHV